jgi:hypothetical protein
MFLKDLLQHKIAGPYIDRNLSSYPSDGSKLIGVAAAANIKINSKPGRPAAELYWAWGLHFSGMLCGVGWQMVTDSSGEQIGRIFKSQAVHEECRKGRNVSNQMLTYAA